MSNTPAFISKNMAAIAYANGFTLWQYKTSAAMAEVTAAGYFSPAQTTLADKDLIILQASDQTAHLLVRKAEDGTVTVEPLAAAAGSAITPAAAIADLALTEQGDAYDKAALNASLSAVQAKLNEILAAMRSNGTLLRS